MAQTNFIRFFNEKGEDANFVAATGNDLGVNYTGSLFFPRVSVNLIESKQLFLLEEVSAFFKEPQLRKLQGEVQLTAGSPFVVGVNSSFNTELVGPIGGTSGDTVRIISSDYEVFSVNGATAMEIFPWPSVNVTTENFYLLDYLWYNTPFKSTDVDTEEIVAEFEEETGSFFFYNVTYTDKVPLIEKTRNFSVSLEELSTLQDPRTGRMIVSQDQNVVSPVQANIGFSSTEEGIYEELLTFYLKKNKLFEIDSVPVSNGDGTWNIDLNYLGYVSEFEAVDKIYLARNYGTGYQYFELNLQSVSEDFLTTVKVKEISTDILSTISSGNLPMFSVRLIWKEPLLYLNLYAEAESEDERFRLTLENFGRKIDEENEYIFRDSDIEEELTDYVLLNKKRKEMLLEGDKIFPYMGSYKALINILNLFGYYDVEIKEYFLNVDSTSPDNGKFLQVPIAKSSEQKKIIKRVWDLLPSKIYKKTSLFGLFYQLNKESGEYDDYGLPIVTEDYQFSPEEVLIKLFGLKELLKKEYLPLNARIYDITGEGLYFERYNFETWNDTVDIRVLDIGKRPVVKIFPEPGSYIRDVRRIDQYYVNKFSQLGYSGFLGEAATAPDIIVQDNTFSVVDNSGNVKQPVQVATIGGESFTVTSGDVTSIVPADDQYTIDGYGLTVGERILVKNAPAVTSVSGASFSNQPGNGIYVVTGIGTGLTVSRSLDADTSGEFTDGFFIYTMFGSQYANQMFALGTTGSITLSTTPLEFRYATAQEIYTGAYTDPDFSPVYSSPLVSSLFPYYVGSFNDYNLGKWAYRDANWDTMPPGIYDPDFNAKAAYYKVLPDDPDGSFPSGAPALIETIFELLWKDSDFSWDQCSTLNAFLASYEVTGATATITDLFNTVGSRGFVNGDRVTISSSPFDGTYTLENASGYTFDVDLGVSPELLTGKLAYSQDIAQIPSTINRLSWNTIGRGEYIDMRVVVEKYGENSYVYDSGRKPIEEFETSYFDSTTGLTYSRILEASLLPYEGTYDISVYIYDITNNFTMQYVKYDAITPTAQITASYQKQEIYDSWDDMKLRWFDSSFDWYYPAKSSSVWENADLMWDSLQAYSYRNQSLRENKTLVDIVNIDRTAESVTIQGDYTNSPYAVAGDYLYFERISNKLEMENYETSPGDISVISDTQFTLDYSGDAIQLWSRLLVKNSSTIYYNLTTSDFFYADVIGVSGNIYTLEGPAQYISIFEDMMTNSSVYLDGGLFAGTYAIEIMSVASSGSDTVFYLKDTQKELYKLDGYFQPFLTTYDVDYAEMHIGKHAKDYENQQDVNWDNLKEKSWWSEDRKANANAGFVISQVAPGGKIQIGESQPFIFSGDVALSVPEANSLAVAVRELNSSSHEEISKFDYELYPSKPKYLVDSDGNQLYLKYPVAPGATSIEVTTVPFGSSTPYNLKTQAVVEVQVSLGGVVSATVISSGSGYDRVPVIYLEDAGETSRAVLEAVIVGGKLASVNILDPGTGYASSPDAQVEAPRGLSEYGSNVIWLGDCWHFVSRVNDSTLYLDNEIEYPVDTLYKIAVPYNYHKQTFNNVAWTKLKAFYYFIVAKSKTPALRSLQSVTFDKGVEGEWKEHPTTSFTHPLKNSLLFYSYNLYTDPHTDLTQDSQYQYWTRLDEEFPVQGYNDDDSRALYTGAFYEPFAYSDAVVTPYTFEIGRATTVVFHDDSTRLPKKRNRIWRIVDEETGKIEVEALSDKLQWNFSKKGNFTVSLEVSDRYGNTSRGVKKSFVVVK